MPSKKEGSSSRHQEHAISAVIDDANHFYDGTDSEEDEEDNGYDDDMRLRSNETSSAPFLLRSNPLLRNSINQHARRLKRIRNSAWDHIYARCKKLPVKTTLAALAYFITGFVLLAIGIWCVMNCDDRNRAIALLVLGSLLFVPGSYSVFVIYKVVTGNPDFNINQLPSYD